MWLFSFPIFGIPIKAPTGTLSTTRKSIFAFSLPNVTGICFATPWQVAIVPWATVMVLLVDVMSKSHFVTTFVHIRFGLYLCVTGNEHHVRLLQVDRQSRLFKEQCPIYFKKFVFVRTVFLQTVFVNRFGLSRHLLGVYTEKKAPMRCWNVSSPHHIERLFSSSFHYHQSSFVFALLFLEFAFVGFGSTVGEARS